MPQLRWRGLTDDDDDFIPFDWFPKVGHNNIELQRAFPFQIAVY